MIDQGTRQRLTAGRKNNNNNHDLSSWPSPLWGGSIGQITLPSFPRHGPPDLWSARLKSRRTVTKEIEKAESDKAFYEETRKLYPITPADSKSVPRWEGSDAEKLMMRDVKAGKHNTMLPRELRMTNAAYEPLPLNVFRRHIYEEKKTAKFHRTL